MADEDTPINNQLLEYRLKELFEQNVQIIGKMDDFLTAFNNHTREDAIVADRLVRLEEDRKSSVGLWSGIGGAISGAAAVIYSMFSGGK